MMKKESIITLPDPRLRQKASKVAVFNNKIKKLITDMESVALDWEKSRPHEVSVALAANQIGQMYQIIILRDNIEDLKNHKFNALINPKITKLEGEVAIDLEGCLSVPDIYGQVPRHQKIKLEALDANGNKIKLKAEGFLARTLQHEVDHINGITFIDHIKNNSDAFFELKKDGKLKKIDYERHIKNNNLLW